MSYLPSDILYFREYTFNDTGETRPHFGLVIVPPKLTTFKESIYCAVITSKEPNSMRRTHKLTADNYNCLSRDSFIKLALLDYVPEHGLDQSKTQPVGKLIYTDILPVWKKLKLVIFNPNNGVDKYLRGAIIREWKKIAF